MNNKITIPDLSFKLTKDINLKFDNIKLMEESKLYSEMFNAYLSLENIILKSGYAIKTKNNELTGVTNKKIFNK